MNQVEMMVVGRACICIFSLSLMFVTIDSSRSLNSWLLTCYNLLRTCLFCLLIQKRKKYQPRERETLLENEISLCAGNRQGYRVKPSEKLILKANRQANTDRDKVTEKIKLPVSFPTEIISLTGFSCVLTHKIKCLCQIKESVKNHFPVGPYRQGNRISLSVTHQCY